MNDQLFDNFLFNKQSSSSPLTELADSGIVSRITPLSSINDNKLFRNPIDDDDNASITSENQYLSFRLNDINKRMILFYYRFLHLGIFSGAYISKM
jgi:hypothetical protein